MRPRPAGFAGLGTWGRRGSWVNRARPTGTSAMKVDEARAGDLFRTERVHLSEVLEEHDGRIAWFVTQRGAQCRFVTKKVHDREFCCMWADGAHPAHRIEPRETHDFTPPFDKREAEITPVNERLEVEETRHRSCSWPPNDIEFSGEEEGAQRLTMSPLQ